MTYNSSEYMIRRRTECSVHSINKKKKKKEWEKVKKEGKTIEGNGV